ncbi:STAS domain-containing protein [Streptomyces echinatus]|uniref:Anti-sigma factor antagonist n=1 Tax=Streptomyces echinatus TaxID=67293 RepID=A0A7W9PR72_9ACTN|nr:STAS domain-containing protein [Streptomyces echinatus]MBB5926438.1 anti-anti-sigma factor [Streptomyces echinatus]
MNNPHSSDRPDRLIIEHHMNGGVRVVAVHGEIDHGITDVLRQAPLPGDDALPLRVVADLSGATFMDSSGLNVLIATHRQVSDTQGWLRIAGAQASVQRLLELVGVDAVIPCHPTVETGHSRLNGDSPAPAAPASAR